MHPEWAWVTLSRAQPVPVPAAFDHERLHLVGWLGIGGERAISLGKQDG